MWTKKRSNSEPIKSLHWRKWQSKPNLELQVWMTGRPLALEARKLELRATSGTRVANPPYLSHSNSELPCVFEPPWFQNPPLSRFTGRMQMCLPNLYSCLCFHIQFICCSFPTAIDLLHDFLFQREQIYKTMESSMNFLQ